MVSTRKLRNLIKHNAEINEDWSDKDATVVHRSRVRDGSYSDCESNGSPETSRNPQKPGLAKLQSMSKTSDTRCPDLLQSQPDSSSYGCLSLLKEKIPGDETSALDALHTLADGPVNILRPFSNAETESSTHIKGSKGNESDDKPSAPATVPLFEKNANSRKRKKIERLSEIANNEMVTRKSARLMKDPHHDGITISEVEQQDPHNDGSAISEVEAMDNMDATQNALSQKSDSMSKARSSHKLGILKSLAPECKPSEVADDSRNNITNPVNSVVDLKDKLRRWCMSEWCCTAIDCPWFPKNDFFAEYLDHVKLGHESAKNEFVKCLNQVEMGHGPKLIRVEWGVITSSFGKPRRFSKQFLQEEREKLSQYHESVGQQYPDLQSVVREGLPTDLARPLAVGQGAIACHPKTRELHDGSVLTVDRNRCRVLQIDGSELKSGFEFVMGTNMQREVTHLRWKIMCEISSSRVNIRDLPGYLLANDW